MHSHYDKRDSNKKGNFRTHISWRVEVSNPRLAR